MCIPSGFSWWTNAGQEDLLNSATWGLHVQCIAIEYFHHNTTKIFLFAGEGLSIRLIVFPQSKFLLLRLPFSNTQFISAWNILSVVSDRDEYLSDLCSRNTQFEIHLYEG